MKAAAVRSNKQIKSRAAAYSIFQKKSNQKGVVGFAYNHTRSAAGRLKSVPTGPAASSKLIRFYAPSPITPKGKPIQKYKNLDGTNTIPSYIYGIFKQVGGKISTPSYIGQSTLNRQGKRFQEHVTTDKKYPWYYAKHPKGAYGKAEKYWPYVPRTFWTMQGDKGQGITKLETTGCEEYCYEEGLKKGWKLLNGQQPIKKTTWKYYKKIPGTFVTGRSPLKANWEPYQ